jgi:hypothetical protein
LRVLRCYGGVGDGGRRHVQRRGPSATTGRWRSARWRECPSAFAFGLRCPPLRSCRLAHRDEHSQNVIVVAGAGTSNAISAKTLSKGTAAPVRDLRKSGSSHWSKFCHVYTPILPINWRNRCPVKHIVWQSLIYLSARHSKSRTHNHSRSRGQSDTCQFYTGSF